LAYVNAVRISPKVPIENSPLRYASIASKATRRLDVGENVKIELDDGVQCLGGGAMRRLSGKASRQAAYSACKASSSATASRHRCGLVRRSTGHRPPAELP
jgi:hypothetical protein